MQRITAVALALAVTATPAVGSGTDGGGPEVVVPRGARVRVSVAPGGADHGTPQGKLVGVVTGFERNRLWVKPSAGEAIVVPVGAIDKLEISRGWHSRKRGAAIGAAVGAGGGLVATALVAGTCEQSATECGFGTNVTAFAYTPLAMALGALVGAAVPPAERWEEVQGIPVRIRVEPLAQRTGLGVGVSVSF